MESRAHAVLDAAFDAGAARVVLGTAALRPPSPARACAVFLVVYCAVASYTEVGLGDASPYLLCLAASARCDLRVRGQKRVP